MLYRSDRGDPVLGWTRRGFLKVAAAAAGAAALAGCTSGGDDNGKRPGGNGTGAQGKGSVTEPLPAPKNFAQSPTLTDKLLPPVAERLPDHPYVVPHRWISDGKYGGRLNMNVFSSQGAAAAASDYNFSYGHSPLRWLNDGQDIGPGIAESWETNDDATRWTFHFRKGLKWSDGEPWSTADILFWWEEFVLAEKMGQVVADEARSGTGKPAEFSAPDDHTLTLIFDAPAPLTADRIANWVNGNVGRTGPIWSMPRHYLKRFHPKWGKKIPDDWDAVGGLMETKADWHRNPDCPTLTGWRCQSFDNNSGVVLERNPYYWCVAPNGDQLPYLDELQFTVVTDPEAGKLQIQQGNIDFCYGRFNQIALGDVQGIRDSAKRSGVEVLLWDSGAGGGLAVMFNYDYVEDELREVIRKPEFRRAISHAYHRDEVRRSVYFNTGELTTGTMSPKAVEYHVNDTGKQMYQQWRDSYVGYDQRKARELLDKIGVKDTDGDGIRELPSGKPLTLRLDYHADNSQGQQTRDNQLVSDLKAIGIKLQLNPVPPQSYDDQWQTGKLMIRDDWEIGDGPNHLVYPQFFVPIEAQRWAPLQGQWYVRRGSKLEHTERDLSPWKRHPPRLEPEPDGPIDRLWQLYDRTKTEPDEMKRHQLVWDMIKIHIDDGPFMMGTVANYPQVMLAKTDLRNVPRRENLMLGGYVNPWIHPTPAVYDPECWFWADPSQH